MTQVPRIEIRPGYEISRVIKGGWQLAGDHGAVDGARAQADMAAFVAAGVTAFDCADIYTGVEDMIGGFLRSARGQGLDLSQVRVHTKYVPDREALATLRFADVEAGVDRSLQRLGTERLDLVQFHWWDYAVPGCLEAMAHLSRLQAAGKIDRLGVTNFDAAHLERLCAVADVATAQVQASLLDARAAGDFAQVARAGEVHILAYGTLAGGFLTERWRGQSDPGFAFDNRSLVKYRLIIEEFGGWDLFQDLLATLHRIGARHGVGLDTIALRATLDSPHVAAAIVGARYADRLPQTLRVFDLAMTEADRADLDAVLGQRQGPSGAVFGLERDTSGAHGRIMKYNLNSGDNRVHDSARAPEA